MESEAEGARRFSAAWKAGFAVLMVLVVVGLPPARVYSDPGWAPFLAAATLVAVGVVWWMARTGPVRPASTPSVSLGEGLFVGVSGLVLTTLFWVRAHLGVPAIMLGDLPLSIAAMGGWAWPALLLVVLFRRWDEGLRMGGRRRAGILVAVAFVAGTLGYLIHRPVLEALDERPRTSLLLERPLASSPLLSLTGGPRGFAPEPTGVVFDLSTLRGRDSRRVSVQGGILPGLAADLSLAAQGTRLTSGDPEVVGVEISEEGRWYLRPEGPGGALITLRNGRARSWIGVWVVEGGRMAPEPPVEVTDALEVEMGGVRPPEEGFAELQEVTVRNVSGEPLLGPLHLAFRLPDDAGPVFVGGRRTTHPEVLGAFEGEGPLPERGIPWVEALPGPAFPRSPAPVLGPGESISIEVAVTGPLHAEIRVFRSLHGL